MLRQHTAGVAPPKTTYARQCAATTAARKLAIERGHLGVTNALLQRAAPCDTNRAGSVLATEGELHGVKVDGLPKHWFASSELAMRWLTSAKPPSMGAGVKVQRLPAATHDARYQCAPSERPAGAGFAAAGIGHDVTTGQAWGAQA